MESNKCLIDSAKEAVHGAKKAPERGAPAPGLIFFAVSFLVTAMMHSESCMPALC